MAIFLLSLMGIPPLVGFMGKLYVFAAIIEKGPSYTWYAVVAALNAAIAAYYYARILKTMIIDAGNEDKAPLSIARRRHRVGGASSWPRTSLPLLFWGAIDVWARSSVVLFAGR